MSFFMQDFTSSLEGGGGVGSRDQAVKSTWFNLLHIGIGCVQLVTKGGQECLHLLTATFTVGLHNPVYMCVEGVWGQGVGVKDKYLSNPKI